MEDEHTRSTTNNTKPTASKTEVISSAKVIIDAAKTAFANENDKIDKAQVAEAAADLLEATSHYGKLEDKSYGKMINKAEDYLHKYNSSHSPHHDGGVHGHGNNAHASHGGKNSEHGKGGHESLKKDDNVHHDEHSSGGGYGEYVKFAQGILKK